MAFLNYYLDKNGDPWAAIGGTESYIVVHDTFNDDAYLLFQNGSKQFMGKFSQTYGPYYTKWVQTDQKAAYRLLGLQQPTRKYYANSNGELLTFFGVPVAVCIEGDYAYAIQRSGHTTRIPAPAVKVSDWKEVSMEKMMSMLGHRPTFDASALEEVWGAQTKKPEVTKSAGELIAKTLAEQAAKAVQEDEKSPLLFRHMRYHHRGNDGEVGSEVQGNGGLTVGFVINHTQKKLEIYPAVCSLNDTYTKEAGRAVAEHRYNAKQGFVIPYDPSQAVGNNLFDFAWGVEDGEITRIELVDGCKGDDQFIDAMLTFLRVSADMTVW